MFSAMSDAFTSAAVNDSVRAVVYAGTGPSFCAGGDFVGILRHALLTPTPALMPGALRARIATVNEAMFEMFLGFPKPLVAAVNGPAIGGGATSCALCDAVVASERASFLTPFAQLGVHPEGCSSAVFPARFGEHVANRLLEEGWKPSARDALAFGLVDEVVDDEPIDTDAGAAALLDAARARAATLADAGCERRYHGYSLEEMRAVNAAESLAVANAFVSTHFLDKAIEHARARGAKGEQQARFFGALRATHGAWSLLV